MKIAVLWSGLSGYMNACLKALAAAEPGVELLVSHMPVVPEAPFDEAEFAWIPRQFEWQSGRDAGRLNDELESFQPELILVAGWHEPVHRPVLRQWRGRCCRLMAMDNAWRGSWKQWLGAAASPLHVLPLADAAFVPGDRQHRFADHLGFRHIYRGSLSCDFNAFHQVALGRGSAPLPESFLYVGRLEEYKGILLLLAAYDRYRRMSKAPWPLIVTGAGTKAEHCRNRAGVDFRGFTEPRQLPELMREAGCQVIPSSFEPWGLVVHEAAAAGLPLIVTTAVGAVDHLLEPGGNGLLIPPNNAEALTQVLLQIESTPPETRAGMGRRSVELAAEITPEQWARQVICVARQWALARAKGRV